MRNPAFTPAWLGTTLAALALQGCGVASPELPIDTLRILVSTMDVSTYCAHGGHRVDAGLDIDGNGVLDGREITHTVRLCADSGFQGQGVMLVRVGGNADRGDCPGGGFRLAAGPDANGDGRLDAAEVRAVANLCNRARFMAATRDTTRVARGEIARVLTASGGIAAAHGSSELLARIDADPGLACRGTASRATSGVDANRNGVLDAAEVAVTQVACGTGAAPPLAPATLSLPAEAAIGAAVQITGSGGNAWRIAQSAGQRINTEQLLGPWGGSWTPAGPRGSWTAVAQSADGRRIVAAGGGVLLLSRDGGAHWSTLSPAEAAARFAAVALSGDGSRLAASARDAGIQVSEDGGITWDRRAAGTGWGRLAASGNLQLLLAERHGDELWLSRDAGHTWQRCSPRGRWVSLASSADGTVLVAAAHGGPLHVSEDGGGTWHARTGPSAAAAVALSADGARLFVAEAAPPHALRRSDDLGRRWVATLAPGNRGRPWTGLAVSGHGHVIVAANSVGELWTSTDGGARWQVERTPLAITAVAVNSEGLARLALTRGAPILRAAAATTPGPSGALSFARGALGLRHVGMGVWSALPATGPFQVQ